MVPVLLMMPLSGSMAPSLIVMDARVVRDRRLIKHEVARGERSRIDAMQGDRLAVAKGDHRVAAGIVGQIGLDVTEARNAGKADEVDFVGRGIEIVDRCRCRSVARRRRDHSRRLR